MIILCEEEGLRADRFLAEEIGELSRSAVQKLLEEGHVLLNGKPVSKSDRTVFGAEYAVTLPEPRELGVEPENIPLDIVYEDGDLLVINKKKGMVVHPAPGHNSGTLVNALLYHCRDLSGINGVLRPGIVHRIDMDTSGLIVVAKNDAAHRALAEQLKDHSLARTYEAIACGNFREDRGTVSAPIGRNPADRKKMAVTEKNSKDAVTHWEVLGRYPGYSHLRLHLETGRTHQIRVHMAYLNHPLLGDTVYGRKKAELGQGSQCLHARELTFLHPSTGERITVSCELPDYFREVLEKLQAMGGSSR